MPTIALTATFVQNRTGGTIQLTDFDAQGVLGGNKLVEGPQSQNDGTTEVYTGTLGTIVLLDPGNVFALRNYRPNLANSTVLDPGFHLTIEPDPAAGVVVVPPAFAAFPPLPPVHVPAGLKVTVTNGPVTVGNTGQPIVDPHGGQQTVILFQ
jgi:hypothetical protein